MSEHLDEALALAEHAASEIRTRGVPLDTVELSMVRSWRAYLRALADNEADSRSPSELVAAVGTLTRLINSAGGGSISIARDSNGTWTAKLHEGGREHSCIQRGPIRAIVGLVGHLNRKDA